MCLCIKLQDYLAEMRKTEERRQQEERDVDLKPRVTGTGGKASDDKLEWEDLHSLFGIYTPKVGPSTSRRKKNSSIQVCTATNHN